MAQRPEEHRLSAHVASRQNSAYWFLAFPLTLLLGFTLVPTVLGLGLSLFTWDGAGTARFVGLRNFRGLLADPKFGPALRNTLIFVVGTVPLTTFLGFLLAVAVNAKWFVGRTACRVMLFLPTIVSIIAIGFVWRWMLDSSGGLAPAAFRFVGLTAPDFLQGGPVFDFSTPEVRNADGSVTPAHARVFLPWLSWPLLSIILVQIWRGVGFAMVLYLAALQGISESLYEAAEVDGASRWATVRHITWPQAAPMTAFLLVTGVIGALQVFDLVWALTATTETDSTRVLNLYVFREFQQSRLGYAAAIGVVIFGLTIMATGLQLALRRRSDA